MTARRRILVVEDERIVAKDLQRALIGFGYDVPMTAATASDAVRCAMEIRPDLVLMDIRIKGAVDGIEAAAELRARLDIPIIYLTAYTDDETIARAKATTPHGYLMKPVKSEELRSTVEIALYKAEVERRLRERERWFATTLRSIGDAVVATDPAGAITYMNLMAELLTGRRLADSERAPVSEVVQLHDELTGRPLENPIFRALREQTLVSVAAPALLTTPDGQRPIDDCAAPITEDGKLLGAVLVLRDVSEDRRLQAQVMAFDRLTSLGTMAAGLSHEMNNPLAIVIANAAELAAALARTDAPGPAELDGVRRLASDIELAAGRVAKVVADLSTFARAPQDGQACDVSAAIAWAIRVTEHEVLGRARIVVDHEPVPPVTASEAQLGQVFVNLIGNAARAMADAACERNEIRIASRCDERGRVVVTVADNGRGMSPEVRARMFEPFFTTRPVGQGSGLGLAVTHGIVTALGGEIGADSSEGVGTTVTVCLPPAARPAPRARSVTIQAPARRCSVVLIDDEVGLLHALRRTLARDHDVQLYSDPVAALDYLLGRPCVDLVLCDLMMPVLTGMDLYARLVEAAPDIASKVVFLTGGAYTASGIEFLRTTTRPHLDKPFSPQGLREFVARFVAGQRAGDGHGQT